MRLKCGCQVTFDRLWGIHKSAVKCHHHRVERKNQPTGEKYYIGIGAIENGEAPSRYIEEWKNALGPIPNAPRSESIALEVGCGASPYVVPIVKAGYWYVGIDLDNWAINWIKTKYGVSGYVGSFEGFTLDNSTLGKIDLILSAHSLEHFANAPACLTKMYRLLSTVGKICLIVPDNTDLANPDHFWFFNEKSLFNLLKRIGFKEIQITTRKVVEKENFIYAMARKTI